MDEEDLGWDEAWDITKEVYILYKSYYNGRSYGKMANRYGKRFVTKNLYDNRRNK